ncbi:MAG TPA: ABC transporter permease subunit [Kiritimatiellia bacterium]|nr:ABC transporter permease subunit [Kiritimatiellia bacterium]HMO99593.1 ABC transporter permease subunit [Kiritimatiellia bacterium]
MNPLARKRWNRFRRHRRGFWSMVMLLLLYGISLFAEFIANDRPLHVRFEGRSYFPVLRFYPDDTFTGSGRQTRPDYKAIRDSEAFQANPANRMLFPPVPHGPNEIIKPDSLRGEEQVTVALRATPRVGSVNLDADLRVVREQAAAYFLVGLEAGEPVTSAWDIPAEIGEAIGRRLRNEAAPAVRAVAARRGTSGTDAEISLAAYTPRARPPADVRVTFREVETRGSRSHALVFNRALERLDTEHALWERLTGAQQEQIRAWADRGFARPTVADPVTIDGAEYAVHVRLNDIQWPFRPVRGHWWGIDNAGRDVFARILYGLRTSMTFGLLLVMFSMGFGIVMGAVQGYFGGKTDLIAQRVIEIWSTIPFLYVMILLGSVFGRSFGLLLFCYAIFNWIGISYYVRAEFLRLRTMPFVDAARCLGLGPFGIMFRHILPNGLTPIITLFPFSLVGAIGSLAVLDYLGFGLPPPTPSWGELLQQAQMFRWAWWLVLYPSLALFVIILLGVFMGEGVRDAYDPKPLTRME